MSQDIRLRRSAVQGKVPTTAQLELGEIAINTYDGKLYFKKDDGAESIVTIDPAASVALDDLSDVDLTLAPSDGQILIWNATAGQFNAGDPVSSVSSLTDVNLTGLTNNSVLKYDSVAGEWIIGTNSTAQATANVIRPFAFARVEATTNGSGTGISWANYNTNNNTFQFTFTTPQPDTSYSVVTDCEWIDDNYVAITSKTTSGFVAEFYDPSGGVDPSSARPFTFVVYGSDPSETIYADSYATIGDLPDVDLSTAPTSGQILEWDGSAFVPTDLSITESQISDLQSYLTTLGSVGGHTDVDITTTAPTDGQVLAWDSANSKFVPADQTGGGGTVANDVISVASFTGDGTTVAYTLPATPLGDEEVLATINGVVQHIDAYSISGTTLTFSAAPDSGDAIELRVYSTVVSDIELRDYATYIYQPSGDQTAFTGADINGATLTYDVGKLEVYLNGVRLVNTLDYTATDGSTVTLLATATTGDTVEVVSLSKSSIVDLDADALLANSLHANTASLATTTADQTVDTFDITVYRSAKYIVQLSHATQGYHVSEVIVIHDGTTAYITEYGTTSTNGSLGTIDATISGSNLNLTVTPANTNTAVSVKRISIGV